jgi:hypothetical protein
MLTTATRLKVDFEVAMESMAAAPFWKDKEGAIKRAVAHRDEVLDKAFYYCKLTGQRVEDVLDLPR